MFDFEKIKTLQAIDNQLCTKILVKQKVKAVAVSKNNIGIEFVIDEEFYGLLYYNFIPEYVSIAIGQELDLYVLKIRSDNKIDLFFHNIKEPHCFFSDKILKVLNESPSQSIELDKKASPKRIFELFSMSRRKYKKALQTLIRDELVSYKDSLIKLLKP